MTRRYAHLRPDHLGEADRARLAVDLLHSGAEVLPMAQDGTLGQRMARGTLGSEAREAISG